MKKHLIYSLCMSAALMAAACADDKGTDPAPDPNPDPVPEEYYAGGKLGTAFNTTSVAYEQPTPVVDDDAAMTQRFLNGEALFEKPFTANSSGVRYGLGPLYIRTSACTATRATATASVSKARSTPTRSATAICWSSPTRTTIT